MNGLSTKTIRSYGTGGPHSPIVVFQERAALYMPENLIWCSEGGAFEVESIWTTPRQAAELFTVYHRYTLFRAPQRVSERVMRVDLFPIPRPSRNKRVDDAPLNGKLNATDGAVLRFDYGAYLAPMGAHRRSFWSRFV